MAVLHLLETGAADCGHLPGPPLNPNHPAHHHQQQRHQFTQCGCCLVAVSGTPPWRVANPCQRLLFGAADPAELSYGIVFCSFNFELCFVVIKAMNLITVLQRAADRAVYGEPKSGELGLSAALAPTSL